MRVLRPVERQQRRSPSRLLMSTTWVFNSIKHAPRVAPLVNENIDFEAMDEELEEEEDEVMTHREEEEEEEEEEEDRYHEGQEGGVDGI